MGFIPFSLDEVISSVPSGFKNLFLIFHSNKKKSVCGFPFQLLFSSFPQLKIYMQIYITL